MTNGRVIFFPGVVELEYPLLPDVPLFEELEGGREELARAGDAVDCDWERRWGKDKSVEEPENA
jgi:hypothetical protein